MRPYLHFTLSSAPALVLALACTADDSRAGQDGTSTATSTSTTGASETAADDTAGTDDGSTTTVGPQTGTDTGTSTSTETGPTGCMGDEDCTEGTELFCDTDAGVCGDCTTTDDPDGACTGLDAGVPVCDGGSGGCVQCTAGNAGACEGVTPLCDMDTSTCVGCEQHEECPGSACHIPSGVVGAEDADDGACFGLGSVVVVDGDGLGDFMTLEAAVASVGNNAEAVFLVQDWALDYNESVTVGSGKSIAMLAGAGQTPLWTRTGNDAGTNPNLRVEGGATVFLYEMRVNGNDDPDGPGIEVDGARLHAQRSRIVNNAGGGIGAVSGAVLDVENCYVSGSPATAPAIAATSSSVAVRYSTLVRGFNAGNPVMECTSPTSTSVRDSIVVNETPSAGPEVACAGATVETSALATTGDASTWFEMLASGDYDLTASGVTQFGDVAEWNTGDPATDIDGTLRPTMDGTSDVAGAYLP